MKEKFIALLTFTSSLRNFGTKFIRVAILVVFVWIGGLTLASKEYLAEPGTNECFILKHSVGALPDKSEVDVPLTYADYYFLEALLRYKNLQK